MAFAEHDDVIDAFAANRAHEAKASAICRAAHSAVGWDVTATEKMGRRSHERIKEPETDRRHNE